MAAFTLFACSSDDNANSNSTDDFLNQMKLVQTITNEAHSIKIYTKSGVILTGYNNIYLQIQNADGTFVEDAQINWMPMMYMTAHAHSSPKSAVVKAEGSKNTYGGFIVFQMASHASEYWELTLNYTINGQAFSATDVIQVNQAPNRNVQSFKGTDGVNYVVAMVEPTEPKVAVNNMSAVLYKMDMHDYSLVTNYTIAIDPRMPGMGNHSSPNNQNLTPGFGSFYYGKLSLTMTGYWTINLQVLNELQEVIKGEAITPTNTASSIYFDLEF
ncbi:hypothetical protein K5I29_00625 [Flavobacterium agricola]|uniref:YtkA-like domain-containing protein n=1 Tax=Flavobacterium agricola TaxID=2870839 RepID=A0ABY6LYT6_9FLAO|nr:hypothetical protein [Flavobacterium agricola]UYW01489.1 hypothetical protein K5I29_00625 [Flavobacterium agricola]